MVFLLFTLQHLAMSETLHLIFLLLKFLECFVNLVNFTIVINLFPVSFDAYIFYVIIKTDSMG